VPSKDLQMGWPTASVNGVRFGGWVGRRPPSKRSACATAILPLHLVDELADDGRRRGGRLMQPPFYRWIERTGWWSHMPTTRYTKPTADGTVSAPFRPPNIRIWMRFRPGHGLRRTTLIFHIRSLIWNFTFSNTNAHALNPLSLVILSITPNFFMYLLEVILLCIFRELKYLHLSKIDISSKKFIVFSCSPFMYKSKPFKSFFVASMKIDEYVANGVCFYCSPINVPVLYYMSLRSLSSSGCTSLTRWTNALVTLEETHVFFIPRLCMLMS